ncbi:RxLR effector protein [Phytophthora megakarya]|uniref:RxLR effector protein n=1 Tax=Phytophthora megakarya TaxID=4795 RepID=A0A225WAI9_9STRA|nr:RxLR effector protein [Phytophthora megakarya]
MRLMGYLSLSLAVLMVCCGAISRRTGLNQPMLAKPPDTTDHFDKRSRILQSNGAETGDFKMSVVEEDREIIPANVKEALKKIKTKDDTSTIYIGGVGKGLEQGLHGKIVKWYRRKRFKLDYFFQTAYWEFRFLENARNDVQQTPSFETTGPYDKNYRIYVNYVRFYEFFKGPTYNPLIEYGPMFKTGIRTAKDSK